MLKPNRFNRRALGRHFERCRSRRRTEPPRCACDDGGDVDRVATAGGADVDREHVEARDGARRIARRIAAAHAGVRHTLRRAPNPS